MPRVPGPLLPRERYWSIAAVTLVEAALVAIIVIASIQAMRTTPAADVLGVGAMFLLYAGLLGGTLLVWFFYDWLSRALWSRKIPKQAYENTIGNLRDAHAAKVTCALVWVVGSLFYASMLWRFGTSVTVPATCVPATCEVLDAWLTANLYAAISSIFLFFFVWRTYQVYVSEDILDYDSSVLNSLKSR